MKKVLIAIMLTAFSAAIILPVVGSNEAFAAGKKNTKTKKPIKKTPGKM